MREKKFRACPVLSDRYMVGDDGSILGMKGKPIKQYNDPDGYPHVYLVKGKERYYRSVHKLVLLAFVCKPTPKHEVNHKNKIRNDNRLENLEWSTHKENVIHSWNNGRTASKKSKQLASERFAGANNPKAKVTEAIVLSIRRLRSSGMLFKDIANRHSISIAQASAIANNKFWNK